MTSRPFSTALRQVVAALLLATGVASASGSAQAGCGDYLTIDGKPHAQRHLPAAPARPCDGPNCSALPTPTPAPMTSPVPGPTGVKATAAELDFDGGDAPPDLGFRRPTSDGTSVHIPRSVFHPPRTV